MTRSTNTQSNRWSQNRSNTNHRMRSTLQENTRSSTTTTTDAEISDDLVGCPGGSGAHEELPKAEASFIEPQGREEHCYTNK